jgi:hypothetical protein
MDGLYAEPDVNGWNALEGKARERALGRGFRKERQIHPAVDIPRLGSLSSEC